MNIQCPECLEIYEAPECENGKKAKCVDCGCFFMIDPKIPLKKRCPACGEIILMIAQKCRFCGEYLSDENKLIEKKNYLVYILFALFFGNFGIHNFYARQFSAAYAKIIIFVYFFFSLILIRDFPLWIFLLSFNAYLSFWDIAYDPNIPTKERKKICGMPPWIFSVLLFILITGLIIGIPLFALYLYMS